MRETTKETTIFPINLILDVFNTESECENIPADIEGTVWYIISRFDTRVQRVIIGRYKEGKSYEQLGKELGVTRERVRQMEIRSLRQMRNTRCRVLLSLGFAEYIAQIRLTAAESSANKQISAATEVIRIVADRLSKITGDDEISAMMEKKQLNSHLALEIGDLELSVRTYNALSRAGLRTVENILNCGDLSRIRNLGQKSLEEITQKIRDLGFELPRKLLRACHE